jgi:hypothetical protein
MMDSRAEAQRSIEEACATREGKRAFRERMARHKWRMELDLGYDGSALFDWEEWQTWPYAVISTSSAGFIWTGAMSSLSNRGCTWTMPKKACGSGWTEAAVGCFTSVRGTCGWLYERQSDRVTG